MAGEFNQNLQDTGLENFTRYSEGWRDNSMGVLFKGVAEVADTAIKAKDDWFKRRMQEDARAMVEPVREANIADNAGVAADYKLRELPDEAKTQLDRMGKLKKGVSAGSISESYYYSQLDAISKRLRRTYSGYANEIDDAMQGLTGVIPANALRRQILEEAESAKASVDAYSKSYEKRYNDAVDGGLIDSRIYPMGALTMDELNQKISERMIPKFQKDQLAVDLKLSKESGEYNKERASFSLGDALDKKVATVIQDLYAKGGTNYKKWGRILEKFQNDPQSVSKEELAILVHEATIAKTNVAELLEQEADTLIDDNGDAEGGNKVTLRTIVGPDETKKQIDLRLERVNRVFDAIAGKNVGLVNHYKAQADAAHQQSTAKMVIENPQLADLAAMEEKYGPKILDIYLSRNPKALGAIGTMLHNTLTTNTADGRISSIDEAFRQIDSPKKDGSVDRDAVKLEYLKTVRDSIINPDTPAMLRARAIEAWFGQPNEGMITRNVKTFKMMTTPDVLQAVKKYSDETGDKAAWNKAVQWTLKTGAVVSRAVAQEVRNVQLNRSYVALKYDPDNFSFSIIPTGRSDTEGVSAVTKGINYAVEKGILEPQAQEAVNRYNEIIQSMVGVPRTDNPEIDKENIAAFVHDLISAQGIDPKAQKQGSAIVQLNRAFADAIKFEYKSLRPTDPNRAYSLIDYDDQTGKPLVMIDRDAQGRLRRRPTPNMELKGGEGKNKVGGSSGEDRLVNQGEAIFNGDDVDPGLRAGAKINSLWEYGNTIQQEFRQKWKNAKDDPVEQQLLKDEWQTFIEKFNAKMNSLNDPFVEFE